MRPRTPSLTSLTGWTLVVLSLGGCGGGNEPLIPSAILLNTTSIAFTALGQTQQLSSTVQDQNGATLAEASVSWESSNDAVATVSSQGLVTATGSGSVQVTATAGAASAVVDVTVAQTPAQLQKISGDAQTGPVGQPLAEPLTVELRDALGNTISGAAVSFTVTQGAGTVASPSAITDASGRASTTYTIGTTAGPNHQISAVSQGASISAIFLATATAGPAAAVTIHAGQGQTAPPGSAVPTPPAVRVAGAFGNPVSGVGVVFAVASGGGSITGANATTDATGVAQVGSWTLGSAGSNTLTATVSGDPITGSPLTFTATAAAGGAFDIEVRFLGSATPAQQQAFADAEARWESIIIGELPNVILDAAAGECGANSPAIAEVIDDVLILASVEEIDGPGATLAQAGPCYIRTSGSLTILGLMRFDAADLADLEAVSALEDVILHEMGHVLGIGTLWGLQELLADPKLLGGTDPHFTGAQAIAAFDGVGGTAYAGGEKVPVEDQGEAGTADSHWRESVMDDELMTGFITLDASTNPLSIVTVASLADQGYSVNDAAADDYTLAPSLRIASPRRSLHLGDDRLRVPIRVLDRVGRVTGVIRP